MHWNRYRIVAVPLLQSTRKKTKHWLARLIHGSSLVTVEFVSYLVFFIHLRLFFIVKKSNILSLLKITLALLLEVLTSNAWSAILFLCVLLTIHVIVEKMFQLFEFSSVRMMVRAERLTRTTHGNGSRIVQDSFKIQIELTSSTLLSEVSLLPVQPAVSAALLH